MLDYSHYTGDPSYDSVVTEALLSQVGPKFNYMTEQYSGSTGNDDQAFWGFTVLEAAERNLPQPKDNIPPWLDLATNIWNSMVVRWNTTTCDGGFNWQIFPDNPNGMDYKNSVSNGGFFQISARLARATGNATYFEWAQKVWDWSEKVGLFNESTGFIYDGVDAADNCATLNHGQFSYKQAIYTYGAAVLYNYTNGDQAWADRTSKLLDGSKIYFGLPNHPEAKDIMYEPSCEPYGSCSADMKTFKAYLSRFLWATVKMMPSKLDQVKPLLTTSAEAAAKACSGGENGTTCGQKWYTGGYDGSSGLGPQMCALETIQGLLSQEAPAPLKAGEIRHVKGDEAPVPASSILPPTPTPQETTAQETTAQEATAQETTAQPTTSESSTSQSAVQQSTMSQSITSKSTAPQSTPISKSATVSDPDSLPTMRVNMPPHTVVTAGSTALGLRWVSMGLSLAATVIWSLA